MAAIVVTVDVHSRITAAVDALLSLVTMMCLSVLQLLALSGTASSFVAPRTFSSKTVSNTAIYSDGNPPPFADWGQPTAPPAAPPAPASTWNPPAPVPAAAVPDAWAPPPAPAAVQAPPPVTQAVASTGSDPIATLEASQKQSVDTIAATIPDLSEKPDCTWNGEPIAGVSATLDARDAPGPANIAWLASVTIPNKLSSLTIFNGPLTDVPHLLSRVAIVNDNTLQFTLDFRPRAYGAYELKDADGYPGPETLGRKAFEYSGARNEFDSKFGTDEVKQFLVSTMNSFEGATVDTSTPSELDLLTRGPLCMSVSMPLTDGNVAAIAQARAQAASYWLSWATDPSHEHRPGAPVNTQYVYDTKYKQNAYGALLPIYSDLFGAEEGAKLTAAESGPLDEAYVGGGS